MMHNLYQDLFGPVPSRRLGISLGIDLVPHKTCSLDCIYCECGKTTHLTVHRKAYVPTEVVLAELQTFLASRPTLDYLTFSGSGEPTLHSELGQIANFLKANFPDYKIALLTNGTLFNQHQQLIQEVQNIDLILPSLDAASESIFRKLNRPCHKLSINDVINGLVQLRQNFRGQIWLEVFIIPGLNDSGAELHRLQHAIQRINPDRVQLNTLDRPGTVARVKPATRYSLDTIASRLGRNTEIIANFQKREQIASYNINIESTILQTLKRRPCTVDDLSFMLGLHPNEINKYIETLLSQNLVCAEILPRGIFFKLSREQDSRSVC